PSIDLDGQRSHPMYSPAIHKNIAGTNLLRAPGGEPVDISFSKYKDVGFVWSDHSQIYQYKEILYLWTLMSAQFDLRDIDLPITEVISKVKHDLSTNNTLVLSTPPGAGKSTIVPLALLDAPWLQGRKIVMLEPRRLAASSIAHRMAALLGEDTGETVGYRVRFENQTTSHTRTVVVTEGILTRMLHQDNALEDVGLVIFDEFHERRLHTDLSMVLCRESQQVLRPDLRLLIMSATLDVEPLSRLLRCPVVESKGRLHPVNLIHTDEPPLHQLPEQCARTILKALRENDGDVLAFLPGEAEIRKCRALLTSEALGVSIHPLYGQLPLAEQQMAIQPRRDGRRKVVLATAIAETSLTIEGISNVVDSGFTRTMLFDPPSGLSRLKTVRISLDAADQRAGRAGRLGPGTCYRMWTRATELRMAAFRTPEIAEADLTSLLLDLAAWGIQEIEKLDWLTPPPTNAIAQARDTLRNLNAVIDNKITPHGRQLHALPCHPRIAHMLLTARDLGWLSLATDIASLLEERDPLGREVGAAIGSRIDALRKHRRLGDKDRRFDNLEKIARSYRKLLHADEDNALTDPYHTGLLLAHAYPERIAKMRAGEFGVFQLSNGKRALLNTDDDLSRESWLAIAHLDAREGLGKVFLAAPVDPNELTLFAKETTRIEWDTKKGGISATKDLRLGNIALASVPLPQPDSQEVIGAICKAITSEGLQLLSFTDAVLKWQNRVLSLRKWCPGAGWPDVSTPALLQHPEAWLTPYLTGIKKVEDLRRLDLLRILENSIDYAKQQDLNRLAPTHLAVPSGSSIALSYSPLGEPPVLAVRLQEVFGMLETPFVNDGRMPVLLHLLSPGFKPVQVTADLKSFWQTTYFEVRKELKRRYPKHAWPENPLQAQAVRGVVKQNKS